MREKIIVTQSMVDYVESHRDGKFRYSKDFKIKVGEECYVTDASVRTHILYLESHNMQFIMPDNIVGLSAEDLQKKKEKGWLQRDLEEKCKEHLLNTDWNEVRIRVSIAIMQCLCGNVTTVKSAYKKLAKKSVALADALVKELQNT